MQFWDTIVNAAMIGTDKKTIGINELPTGLTESANAIAENNAIDKEHKFLQLASLAFSYRQCGSMPVKKENIEAEPAQGEEKAYCSSTATQVLKDIFREESIPLLKFWLQHCHHKNQIVHPELIPALLSSAVQNKSLQTLITSCCGKRGEWLGGFNEDWNFSTHQTPEEQWKTGTIDQRKSVLREMRHSNPSQAREWLQQTWAQEDANTKSALLEILSVNIDKNDIPFLETLQAEKSKKVKDAANNLLRQIPGSSIVQMYQQVLQESVVLKKEKAMLGLSSKNVLHFQLPPVINEEIFKTGIEKMSAQKNSTDEGYILHQLVSYTPPQFWQEHLNLSPREIIDLFNHSKQGKELVPAIGLATGRFKNADWVHPIIKDDNRLYLDLITMLPVDKQENYIRLHFNNAADTIINLLVRQEKEWSVDLARIIFTHTAKNPYQYSRSFYNQHIHLIPAKIASEIDKCAPAEQQLVGYWNNIRDYILKLLQLKTQIIKSFN